MKSKDPPPRLRSEQVGAGRSGQVWVVVSAPSGAGKTTLVKKLLKKNRNFGFSVSVTTRPPRPGEKNGREYRFVSPKEFERLKKGKKLLEWARIHGHFYGTPRAPLGRKKNWDAVFFDLNRAGARAVKKVCPEAVLVFIFPPDWRALISRLSRRGTESNSERKKRLADARREIAAARFYHYWIVNRTVPESLKRLEAVVWALLSRRERVWAGNKKLF